jgi:PAS domain-containing protein/HPt (histidine-containing phosphotransfer) domain-containing protein
MGIYNFSIAFSTRSRQYLFYSLLCLLSVFREGYLAGLLYDFLWPNHPVFNEYAGIYSLAFTIYLANAFIIDFLDLKLKDSLHYRLLQIASLLSLCYIAMFSIFGYSIAIRPISAQVVINSLLVLFITVNHLRRGYHAARYLIIAWVFILGGFIISAISAYGVIPASMLTKFANPLGQFFEIIFLSFALSDRINSMRRETNNAIRALNKGLERQVREKTQDIQSILDSIPLGILKVDRDGKVKAGHSKFMEQLITEENNQDGQLPIQGRDIREVLLAASNLSSDDIAVTMNILSMTVGESELQWSFNSALLPTQILRTSRIFELIWTPVFSTENGVVQDVLLVIKDVTELRKIETENEKSRKENEIIVKIVKTKPKDFQSFMTNSHLCLETIRKVFFGPKADWVVDDANEVWRQLHTLKGVSRSLGFKEVSSKIHDAESCLREFEGNSSHDMKNLKLFRLVVASIEEDLHEYRRVNHEVLKRDREHGFEISETDMA